MHMKTRILAVATLSLLLALASSLTAAEKEFKATCPVSGGPAKEANSVEYKGKKVYFCCMNCPKAFTADPDKFKAKTNLQLAQTGQIVQVGCPFSGKACNPDATIEVAGVKVGFCCGNCKAKAEKADDQVSCCFDAIDKGFTEQTTCPLSGKPIKADVFVEHEGKKVYFCCPGCPKGFEADPAKYLSKLPQFNEKK